MTASAGCALLAASGAGAIDAGELESKLASARSEAETLAQRIEVSSDRLADLQARADAAAAREAELTARLSVAAERARALGVRLREAEQELEAARARLKRAVGVLSARLVEIYKSAEPDYVGIVLEADGFDDLSTRTEYLDSLQEADSDLAERVAELRDEVAARFQEIGELKAEAEANARRLAAARDEIAAIRAAAERRASELAAARASEQQALEALRSRIDDWAAQVEQLQGGDGYGEVGSWVGDYAIPYAIVLCESGGNYGAYNPSSGAGGAYQILPSTWQAYGGEGLPHQASRQEQDRIAAQIWADSGPGAWVCAG
jgi:septal ring factor EnvC (AmiA/AmiB activator)